MLHKKNQLIKYLFVALGISSSLALILTVWGLYYLACLVSHQLAGFKVTIQYIWLPSAPVLLVLFLTAILAFFRLKISTILLLCFSFYIAKNSILNLLLIAGVGGIDYWLSVLASWAALLTITINLIILALWVYQYFRNKPQE